VYMQEHWDYRGPNNRINTKARRRETRKSVQTGKPIGISFDKFTSVWI
jgi:hypothetical protein